jgi:uncharacterized protein (TIGR02246 family)
MRRVLLCAVVFVFAALTASAQNGAGGQAQQAVLKLEQQWVDALVKADAAALNTIYADDLVYTHSSSVVDTKASYIESLTSGKTKYQSLERDEIKVRVYGDTAIVNSRAKIKVNNNDINVRYIHVYVKQKGGWKMAAHQATRITP